MELLFKYCGKYLIPSLRNEKAFPKSGPLHKNGKQGLLVIQPALLRKRGKKNCLFLERHFLAHNFGIRIVLYHKYETRLKRALKRL
jgi:hypothetical protein